MPALDAQLLAELEEPQIDALIEIMLLAATADGNLADSELSQLRKSLVEIDSAWLSRVDLDQRVAAARERIGAASRRTRLMDLKLALPKPEQRRAALELALRVVTADGIIEMSEHDLVVEVAQVLGVDSGVAGDLILSRLF